MTRIEKENFVIYTNDINNSELESLLERLQKETPSQQREKPPETFTVFSTKVRNLKITPERFYKQSDLNNKKIFEEECIHSFTILRLKISCLIMIDFH